MYEKKICLRPVFFFDTVTVCVLILELVANRMLQLIRVCVSWFCVSVCIFEAKY